LSSTSLLAVSIRIGIYFVYSDALSLPQTS
jgi:hypothetical protein